MSLISRRAALIALALVATACADDAPTASPSVDASARRAAKASSSFSTVVSGKSGSTSSMTVAYSVNGATVKASTGSSIAVTPELDARLRAELARVKLEAQKSARSRDSLQRVFAAGKKQHKKNSPVLVCPPMDYAAEIAIIGPAGGELRAGPHRLVIPAGALRQPTVITAEALVSLARELRFSPHGTQFAVAPTVTMSYKGCTIPKDSETTVTYVDDDLDVLEWPKAKDDKKGEVTGYIWHFSRYATASRSSYATSW